jgi:uncharacterized protein YecT (DUF1311 family)
MIKAFACAVMLLMPLAVSARAETAKPSEKDVEIVETCLFSDRGGERDGEFCIGAIADACLEKAKSTAEMNACSDRERRVWDALLNKTYDELRKLLDAKQQIKLREMQRAWIVSRNRSCGFYWDFHQGTIASPMAAYCTMKETARRALFLRHFYKNER